MYFLPADARERSTIRSSGVSRDRALAVAKKEEGTFDSVDVFLGKFGIGTLLEREGATKSDLLVYVAVFHGATIVTHGGASPFSFKGDVAVLVDALTGEAFQSTTV